MRASRLEGAAERIAGAAVAASVSENSRREIGLWIIRESQKSISLGPIHPIRATVPSNVSRHWYSRLKAFDHFRR